jgi:polar amino acid transport system substrate-binding protein
MRQLIVLFALTLSPLLHAQTTEAPAKKLTVLIKPAKPFVFDKGGAPAGYAIDLWRRVAEEGHLNFDYKQVGTVPEAIDALKANQADVAVGALSVTAEREKVLDFSHPFYKSGLQILVNAGSQRSAFRAFLTLDVLKVLGILLVAIIVNAHILWFSEKKKNPESFPENYVDGIQNALWWSVSTIITLGCENIAPTRAVGRLLGIVWMLAGVALYSYVTATLTSTMTVNNLQSEIRSLSDLQGRDVGTVTGTSTVDVLKASDLAVKGYPDIETACRALAAGEVKAVVYDAPLLKYYLSTLCGSKLQLVGDLFEKQDYAFALPEASPLRREINQALLKVTEDGYLDELDKKWFAPAAPQP